MYGWFIAFIVVTAVLTLPVTLLWLFTRRQVRLAQVGTRAHDDRRQQRMAARYVALLMGAVSAVLLFLSAYVIVPANTAAIMVSLGRPTDVNDNGWTWKEPWTKVVEFDGTRQFVHFQAGGTGEDNTFACIEVKLSNNARACISGTIEWQARVDTPEARAQVLGLYKEFRSFDRVRDFYMRPRIQTVLGEVFSDHNPLVAEQNQSTAELNEEALQKLQAVVGSTLKVWAVTLRVPDYDDTTDAAIANQQAELANTVTAQQKILTAEAEAEAAQRLQEALSGNPEYNVSKCLDITREAINRGQVVEPGLCMSGGSPLVNIGNRPVAQ